MPKKLLTNHITRITLLLFLALGLCLAVLLHAENPAPEKTPELPPATVYFTSDLTPEGVMKVYEPIKGEVRGKVGMKVTFGEEGNQNYIRPEMMRLLQQATNATFVEANVVYPGPRHTTQNHLQVAKNHGFDYAPIDIMDSEGEVTVPAHTKHFNEVWEGSHQKNYDTFIVFSHFKGHMMAGFGGAIKNVSMGMASTTGKMALHSDQYPHVDPQKCIQCGLCLQNCAGDAITLNPVKVNPAKCVGCGKCIAVCPQGVFSVPWEKGDKTEFMEKLAEYHKVMADQTKMVYISVLANISKDCDCAARAQDPFVHNIGILSSTDPVALDKACLDLVNKAMNSKDAFMDQNSVSGNHQLEFGEQIGLGTQKYMLVDLDK